MSNAAEQGRPGTPPAVQHASNMTSGASSQAPNQQQSSAPSAAPALAVAPGSPSMSARVASPDRLGWDKGTLKVHLPNGGFNVVKFGDAIDVKVTYTCGF